MLKETAGNQSTQPKERLDKELTALLASFRCNIQGPLAKPQLPMCVNYNEGVTMVCGGLNSPDRVIGQLHVAKTVHANGHLMLNATWPP